MRFWTYFFRTEGVMKSIYKTTVTVFIFVLSGVLSAAPHLGDVYSFKQPDGSRVQVKVWGDEFYQRVESVDGYSLTRNSSGWICYANLSDNEAEFLPTVKHYAGQSVSQQFITTSDTSGNLVTLPKGLKITPSSRRTKALAMQKQLNGGRSGIRYSGSSSSAAASALYSVVPAPLTGSVVGLTVCVQFPDEAGTLTIAQVNNYCNQVGYTEFGNAGSVYDYYYSVSNGKVLYTNVTVGYYTALNNKSYYDDPSRDCGVVGQELLGEVFDWLVTQGFDFTQLTVDSSNTMLAVNVLYTGTVSSGWTFGLWPHSGYYSNFTSSGGIKSGRYQITDMGAQLTIGTFCHENGHMICQWPDLYDYGYDGDSAGIGMYCLMASGNYGGGGSNPIPPNAYYRDLKGWETVSTLSTLSQNGTVTSNTNNSYKYPNPNNSLESFYIESRLRTGRSTSLPDEGLMIWHVDEAGDNEYQQMTPALHYMVSLEQADGLFDLENNVNYGDSTDLFSADYKSTFNDTTVPDAKWWDGSNSGLSLLNISNIGTTMSFGTAIVDAAPPLPNPAKWDIVPTATGTHTITMKAKQAVDISGVQYQFECTETDDTTKTLASLSSGWREGTNGNLYTLTNLTSGKTYTFRVHTRDKSASANVGHWSSELSATTADGTALPNPDDKDPASIPTVWSLVPTRLGTTAIQMAAEAYDESGVKYQFVCTNTTDPNYNSPAGRDTLSRLFGDPRETNPVYTLGKFMPPTQKPVSPLLNATCSYTFRVDVMDGAGNEISSSLTGDAVNLNSHPQTREVPYPYATIQAAINACSAGDEVIVHPGTYNETNINFGGRNITVRSEDPQNASIVAATIIDCQQGGRAFIFNSGETSKAVVDGFTIINGQASNNGGAIICLNNSSPTISNCVIRNCSAVGASGAPGMPDGGAPGNPGGTGAILANGNPGVNPGDAGGQGTDQQSLPAVTVAPVVTADAAVMAALTVRTAPEAVMAAMAATAATPTAALSI
jgi:M6 family metalloprotease-like protein